MDELFKNVDWEKYGKSKADELRESYRITRVHFAQCSTHLSFDEYLKHEGLFLEEPNSGIS